MSMKHIDRSHSLLFRTVTLHHVIKDMLKWKGGKTL